MIEIRMQDVSTNDRPLLLALSAALQNVANGMYGPLAGPTETVKAGDLSITRPGASVGTLDPADNPAAGTDPQDVFGQPGDAAPIAPNGAQPDPATVFADPSQVFSGNAAAVPAAAPLPTASVPAVASAPVQNTALAPVPSGSTVELDKNGLPWYGRIHSESKSKNKDGSWRNRRGVDAAVIAQIEAELRAALAAPGVAGNVPPAPPVSGPVVDSSASAAIAPAPAPVTPPPGAVPTPPAANPGNVPPPPPANGAPAAAIVTPIASATNPATALPVTNAPAPNGTPPAANAGALTFPQLVPQITARLGDGRLTQLQVTEALSSLGLPSLPSLVQRPDLVPSVATLLGIQ